MSRKEWLISMVDSIVKKDVRSLRVWSDNPRFGYLSDSNMDETTAINTLIDVVGEGKMYALAKDIIDKKGLLSNTLPTVVYEHGEYRVYDGNRRISTIKFLLKPSLIQSIRFQKRIVDLANGVDLSFLKYITVVLTDRDRAIGIMDATHTGERGGAGLIPWGAYERDVSLFSRTGAPQYPSAFAVSRILNWHKKTDFATINYTDLERLFRSNVLKTEFGINELKSDYRSQINDAIAALLNYKQSERFSSFSRQFNTMGDLSDSDAPIAKFIQWYRQTKFLMQKYSIQLEKIEIFERDIMPSITDFISIRDNEDNTEIEIEPESLDISYFNPDSKKRNAVDTSVAGEWKYRVNYQGAIKDGIIIVNRLGRPFVKFGNCSTGYGSTLDLKRCVEAAISSRRTSMIDTLSIRYVGSGPQPALHNNILTGDNQPGEYIFSFTFDNCGDPYSENRIIKIEGPTQILPFFSDGIQAPFVDFHRVGRMVKLSDVSLLMDEVNQAWIAGLYRVAVCGMRATLELTIDELAASSKISFTVRGNLSNCLQEFINHLRHNINNDFTNMANNHPRLSYQNEGNFLNSLDSGRLVSLLHLAAHKSGNNANLAVICESCQKDLSRILCLAELFLR